MNAKFAIGIAMFLSGVAAQIGGIQGGWTEVFTPIFVSGFIVQLSGFILSVWGGVQYQPNRNGVRTRGDDKDRTDIDKFEK